MGEVEVLAGEDQAAVDSFLRALRLQPGATRVHYPLGQAYRRLAKEYHPDRCDQGNSPFQVIQEAYAILSNPVTRRAYDDGRQRQRLTSPHGVRMESMKPPDDQKTNFPLWPDQILSYTQCVSKLLIARK